MPAKSKATKKPDDRSPLYERLTHPGVAEFHMASDEERDIFSVVYKCSNCDDTQTLRFFRHETVLAATNCVKCRAGFGNNPGGMFPLVGDEAAPN